VWMTENNSGKEENRGGRRKWRPKNKQTKYQTKTMIALAALLDLHVKNKLLYYGIFSFLCLSRYSTQ